MAKEMDLDGLLKKKAARAVGAPKKFVPRSDLVHMVNFINERLSSDKLLFSRRSLYMSVH